MKGLAADLRHVLVAIDDPKKLLSNTSNMLRQINDALLHLPELEHLARLVEDLSLDPDYFNPPEEDEDEDAGPTPPPEVMDQLTRAVDDDDAPFPRDATYQLLDWLAGEIDGPQNDTDVLRAIATWLTTLGIPKALKLDTGATCTGDNDGGGDALCTAPPPAPAPERPNPSTWAIRLWVWVQRPWCGFLERVDQLARLVPLDDDGTELAVYIRATTEDAYVKKGKLAGGDEANVRHAQHKTDEMVIRARAAAAKVAWRTTARASTD